jgi:predicted nucleic acid-binding protein
MNEMWLLDTNSMIKIPKEVRDSFSEEKIKSSYVTVLEHPIEHKYEKIEIIYPDDEIWLYCLKLAIRLRKNGTPIPISDLIIASTAIICNLILISDDHHFQLIQQVELALQLKPLKDFHSE